MDDKKHGIVEKSISSFYNNMIDSLRNGHMDGFSGSDSSTVRLFGYPLGELVGIGRALYIASITTVGSLVHPDKIAIELRKIAMDLFMLSAGQGNCVGEFYVSFYSHMYDNRILLKLVKDVTQAGKIISSESIEAIKSMQLLANKACDYSKLPEPRLVLAYAYYFGFGVKNNRDFAIKLCIESMDETRQVENSVASVLEKQIKKEIRMEKRTKIFVSYSHSDVQYEEELRLQLKGIAYSGIVEYWDDSHLGPGVEIDKTIRDEMEKARFIIMLVSPDYMGSWYVRNKEFEPLIHAAKNEGATIYWIPVRPVSVKGTALADIEAVFDKRKSLASTRDFPERADRDKEYAKIAEHIYDTLNP